MDREEVIEGIEDGTIIGPEFITDTTTVVNLSSPGLALSNLGARGFIREFSWLAPQVYAYEVGDNTMTALPAYRNEFIVQHKDTFDKTKNPGSHFTKCISAMVKSRMPWGTRETNNPDSTPKQIKPSLRYNGKKSDLEGGEGEDGYYEVYGQKFENILQFDCWGRSNTEADQLIDWLEGFLVRWEFWFTSFGIDKMFYLSSGSELSPTEADAMGRWTQPFKLRSLEWYVRDEKLYYSDQSEIQAIVARIMIEGGTRRLEYVI